MLRPITVRLEGDAVERSGIAAFFFLTLETRLKRQRALKAIRELRSLAHIIDMHQLTKDPERIAEPMTDTARLARRPHHRQPRLDDGMLYDDGLHARSLAARVGCRLRPREHLD